MSDFGVGAIARAQDSTAGAWPVEAESAVRGEGGPLEVLVESAQRQPRLGRKSMLCAGRDQDEVARSELPRRCAGAVIQQVPATTRWKAAPGRAGSSMPHGARASTVASSAPRAIGADRRVVAVQLDLTDPASIEKLAATATDVDLLVNNAGTAAFAPALGADPEAVASEFAVNFTGLYAMIRAFTPTLAARKGAIVNLLTLLSYAPDPRWPATPHPKRPPTHSPWRFVPP